MGSSRIKIKAASKFGGGDIYGECGKVTPPTPSGKLSSQGHFEPDSLLCYDLCVPALTDQAWAADLYVPDCTGRMTCSLSQEEGRDRIQSQST